MASPHGNHPYSCGREDEGVHGEGGHQDDVARTLLTSLGLPWTFFCSSRVKECDQVLCSTPTEKFAEASNYWDKCVLGERSCVKKLLIIYDVFLITFTVLKYVYCCPEFETIRTYF